MRLDVLLDEVRACRVCEAHLPMGPRPLVRASSGSRMVVIGQAPGAAAHARGTPWDDASGARLRQWLGLDNTVFSDARRVAIMPMGFCYPGTGRGGDRPPRPECAPLWHDRLLGAMPDVQLTVLVGRYAFERRLGGRYATLTEAVRAWADLLPSMVVLPHPSPRNNRWLARHGWFEREALPPLRERVSEVLTPHPPPGSPLPGSSRPAPRASGRRCAAS